MTGDPAEFHLQLGKVGVSIMAEPRAMGHELKQAMPELRQLFARCCWLSGLEIDHRGRWSDTRLFLIDHNGATCGLEALARAGEDEARTLLTIHAHATAIAKSVVRANLNPLFSYSLIRILLVPDEQRLIAWLEPASTTADARRRFYPLVPDAPTGHDLIAFAEPSAAHLARFLEARHDAERKT